MKVLFQGFLLCFLLVFLTKTHHRAIRGETGSGAASVDLSTYGEDSILSKVEEELYRFVEESLSRSIIECQEEYHQLGYSDVNLGISSSSSGRGRIESVSDDSSNLYMPVCLPKHELNHTKAGQYRYPRFKDNRFKRREQSIALAITSHSHGLNGLHSSSYGPNDNELDDLGALAGDKGIKGINGDIDDIDIGGEIRQAKEHWKCVSPTFVPRSLSSDQVSFRARKKDKKDKYKSDTDSKLKEGGKETSDEELDAGAKTKTGEGDNDNDYRTQEEIDREKKEEEDDAHSVVHPYLAFAMVLPGHPYSDTLKQSLKVVAPIYSEITTLVASRGYEFHEFAQQYSVKSFPQLLFFERGILKARLRPDGQGLATYSPASVAVQYSRFSGTFPTAIPLSPDVRGLLLPHKKFKSPSPHTHNVRFVSRKILGGSDSSSSNSNSNSSSSTSRYIGKDRNYRNDSATIGNDSGGDMSLNATSGKGENIYLGNTNTNTNMNSYSNSSVNDVLGLQWWEWDWDTFTFESALNQRQKTWVTWWKMNMLISFEPGYMQSFSYVSQFDAFLFIASACFVIMKFFWEFNDHIHDNEHTDEA